jgi:hypothetical protein
VEPAIRGKAIAVVVLVGAFKALATKDTPCAVEVGSKGEPIGTITFWAWVAPADGILSNR